MTAHGWPIAEGGHVINAMPPIDITGGVESDVWSMQDFDHCTIIVAIGVSAAAFTKIILNACDDFVPTTQVALPFALYAEETAAGDTLAAREAVAAAGKTPSANDNIMYVIEVDQAELLASGHPNLNVSITAGAVAVLASILVICSGNRYADQSRSAIV